MSTRPEQFMSPTLSKVFIGIFIGNTILSIVCWVKTFDPNSAFPPPGRVNSALMALCLSLLTYLAGKNDKNWRLKYLWIPFMMIAFCAIAGYTTYLFTTIGNIVFIYLSYRDLKHART